MTEFQLTVTDACLLGHAVYSPAVVSVHVGLVLLERRQVADNCEHCHSTRPCRRLSRSSSAGTLRHSRDTHVSQRHLVGGLALW